MYKVTVPTVISYSHFDKEGLVEQLCQAKVDRVALALDREPEHTFSSPETLSLLRELVTYFKEKGIEVWAWLGETLGHDSSAETESSPYQNQQDFDIGRSKAFCPLDVRLQHDFAIWIQKIARTGVDGILFDDDYRTDPIPDVKLGCCCPLHMERVEQVLGESITPKELRENILCGGENRYRNAWLRVQKESMVNFSLKMRAALDELSPKTRMGFCICLGWDVTGCDVEEIARALAGDTKPFLRLSGAPYWPRQLGEIVELERTQISMLKGKGIEIISEGDTYPRPRFVTSASRLEIFDMALRADGNCDGILKYMSDYVSSAAYETGYVDAHKSHEALYREIEQCFGDKSARGIRLWNFPDLFAKAEFNNEYSDPRAGMYYKSICLGIACSLPMTYEGNDVGVLFGENAAHISKNQLRQGCVMDLTAADILTRRGIDVGISSSAPIKPPRQLGFTDLPVEYYPAENEYVRLELGVQMYQVEKRSGAKVLTYFEVGGSRYDGIFTYENADGCRFLIFPFDGRKACKRPGWFTSYALRRLLLDQVSWLGEPLLAYVDGNYPYHYSIVKEDENEISVGIWNLFEDSMENVTVRFQAPIESNGIKFINGSGQADGQTVSLNGRIAPYDFVGICVKKK